MSRPLSPKSNTCTERVVVDAAGISGKVKAPYPGRSVDLPALSGAWASVVERRCDGPAEVSRGHSRPFDPAEGPNTVKAGGSLTFDGRQSRRQEG